METLSGVVFFSTQIHTQSPLFPFPHSAKPLSKKKTPTFSVPRTSARPVSEIAEEDVLQIFLRDRQLNGDFISRASDLFWQSEFLKSLDVQLDDNTVKLADIPQQAEQVASENDDGFLKLKKTREWLLGDNSAPMNKKPSAKDARDDSDRRKKLNLLKYEALKRELILMSIGIGTACSGYCLVALSVQAAFSYAVGALFSCLYLQLLYKHADNLSKEMVPPIFMQKKTKKIGIRSEDLKNFLERSIKGSSVALSSPRLVIPAAIYGLWVLSHRYIASDFIDFQLTPAMVGMFVYKAAALVQVYRDNEDLQFIFPENEESSSN